MPPNMYCPRIEPVIDGTKRPLWSVMIPTYHCADYLRITLASVLEQAPGPDVMQIEVVDDGSTHDDPEKVVHEVAGRRVGFYRQPQNVGHTRNFNTCLQRSRGQLVHLLHGDDLVRPSFYATMEQAFVKETSIGAAFCRDIRMDEHGHWHSISPLLQPQNGIIENWLETIAMGQRLQAPAMVVRRDVYEQLGGFDQRISYYGEDWEMWVRIAANYPVWYETEPLALYRIHSMSLSGRTVRTGRNGHDLRQAIALNRAHLPADRINDLSRQASENFALACLRRAERLRAAADLDASMAQLREALKSSWSQSVATHSAIFLARWIVQAMRQKIKVNRRRNSTTP